MSIQNSKIINQKEYLKKYLSGDKEKGKKKKVKKHKKTANAKVKIIDDDAHDENKEELDEDLLFGGEDAPQIVGEYIEQNPNEIRSKWRNIAVKSEEETEQEVNQRDDKSDLWGQKASTIKIKQEFSPKGERSSYTTPLDIKIKQEKRSSSRDPSPARRHDKDVVRRRSKDRNLSITQTDQSPPRRRRNSDQSPPRKRSNQSPRRRRNSDQSPLRKRSGQSPSRRRHDSDESPPGKRSDQNPPRRRRDSDQSPPRKRSDQSPPRRRRNSDQSPPRKRSDQSPPRRRRNSDQSPPRKRTDQSPSRRRHDSDQSPPRKRSDQSPHRRRRDSDQSPPRRKYDRSPQRRSPPRRRQSPTARDRDSRHRGRSTSRDRRVQSPSRWQNNEDRRGFKVERSRSLSPPPTHKPKTRTLDGKKAGLQDAQSLKIESNERRREEHRMFEQMSRDVSGRDAEVQIRSTGRRGRRARDAAAEDPEVQKQKEAHEQKKKERYTRWGKGLKQLDDQEKRYAEMSHEASKPVARYANDEDLDRHLREQEHADDPMLKYMQEKRKKLDKLSNKPVMPEYQGSYPENRYGIRPGYRWDGVDRSNGYEQRWFDKQNERRALQDEAYKYSVEDM